MGANCSFYATSGGSKDDDDEKPDANLVIVIREGLFVDAPVQGAGYASGSLSGITGPNGEFRYQVGQRVRFFIGDINLGEAGQGKDTITPLDLVDGGGMDTPAVINIARLLQSLDSIPGDDRITLPPALHTAAVHSNESIAPYLQFLDYSDQSTFDSIASQLVATLTASYPFTGMLVDAQSARAHLSRNIASLGEKDLSQAGLP
jgi:hypothetical protein